MTIAGVALQFQRIKGEAMAACWPALRGFIEKACALSGGRYSTGWVARQLAARADCLWALIERDTGRPRGVVVTRIGEYPTGLRALEVILLGGEAVGRFAAQDCFQALRAYAREQGCAHVEWIGRPGLKRWLGAGAHARTIWSGCEVAA